MAIDSQFSKDRFRMAAEADPGARQLSEELQTEVLHQLQGVVSKKMEEIVALLNEQGHRLTYYYPPQLGDISFRDDRQSNGTYECDLRLGVDIVVSVGFRDTRTEPPNSE
jgi:hypothetical protein